MITLQSFRRVAPHTRYRKVVARRLKPIIVAYPDETWYRGELLKLVNTTRHHIQTELLPPLKEAFDAQTARRYTTDAEFTDAQLAQIIAEIAHKMGRLDDWAQQLANAITDRVAGRVDEKLAGELEKALRIDISAMLKANPILDSAKEAHVKANVELIKSIPQQYLANVADRVMANFHAGMRWEAMVADIAHIGDVTESRARLIARDQASKLNASFNQVRQTQVGIEKYEWSTSGDERVRETHRENDGKIFFWNNPPAETGHPGEDINCRCVAIPVFDLDIPAV